MLIPEMDPHFIQQLLIGVVGTLVGSFGTGWAMISKLGVRVAVLESERTQERSDVKEIKESIAEIYRLLREKS